MEPTAKGPGRARLKANHEISLTLIVDHGVPCTQSHLFTRVENHEFIFFL